MKEMMPAEPSDRSPSAEEERLWRRLAAGIAVLAVLARFWMSWQTRSLGEDALITLRYAENIAAGRGFVYNPGAHVLGTTTPLYTLFLALAAWLAPGKAMFLGQALNILADGLTCWLLARLLARPEIGQPVAGLFAALLYAFSTTPISVSISGMETGLVTCIGLAMVHAYLSRNSRLLCLLGAVLFLLRIDGLLLLALLAGGLAWQERKIPWKNLGLALLVALPWIVFALFYFGSPVPTSLVAKVTVYSHAPPDRHAVTEPFQDQFVRGGFQWLISLLALAGALSVLAAARRTEQNRTGQLALPLLWVLLYYGTMFFSPVPAFAWYFLPPWPLFLALATLGAVELFRLARTREMVLPSPFRRGVGGEVPPPPRGGSRRLVLALLLLCALLGLWRLRTLRNLIGQVQQQEDTLRRPSGQWFQANAAPNERILLEPIGYVGYFSRRPILDLVGLVSPEVFPSYSTPHYLTDIVRRLKPEWLYMRPSELDRVREGDPTILERDYEYIRFFGGNVKDPAFRVYHRKKTPALSPTP